MDGERICVECGDALTYAPGNIGEWQCTNRDCVFHYLSFFDNDKLWDFARAALKHIQKVKE